jgi:hypothetical protein
MIMNKALKLAPALGLLGLAATACAPAINIPDPAPADYAYQNTMITTHPGMDCVMEWVGSYVTNCYPMTVHPPYSVRVYFPHGCSCPAVLPRPNNYSVPRPIVVNKNTTVVNNNKTTINNAPKTVVQQSKIQDRIPSGYKPATSTRGKK